MSQVRLFEAVLLIEQTDVLSFKPINDVQTIAHDCFIGQEAYAQRASDPRFDDQRAQALFSALVMFSLHVNDTCHGKLRQHSAQVLGLDPATGPAG